jgi:hypothetical protein
MPDAIDEGNLALCARISNHPAEIEVSSEINLLGVADGLS